MASWSDRAFGRGGVKTWIRVLAVVGYLLTPGFANAQDLDEVESLALLGRTEAAREALTHWWDEHFQGGMRADRQRALWLRGLLTVDPELAGLDFRRLVVEYPGGPFAVEALIRLAGAAMARDDLAEVERLYRTVLREYPGSGHQDLVQAWLDTYARANSRETEVLDSRSSDEKSPPGDDMRVTGVHAVQLGAFSSETRALTFSHVLEDAGVEARVVRVEGNSLFRVRVGIFDSEHDAEVERARLVELGFDATVVSNADREVS